MTGPDASAEPAWPGAALRDTRDALDARGALDGVGLDRVTIGESVALVELLASGPGQETSGDGADGGSPRRLAGLAHRPRTASVPSPTDLGGLLAPFEDDDASLGARALAVAGLNALSVPFLDWRAGDPMALLDPDVSRIVTVGLFRPAFRKFDGVEVRVIEREGVAVDEVATPESVTLRSFTPAETADAMAGAEVVFVTGSTLVYGGIERYLDAAPASATVVAVGATASAVPGPLFDRGVDVVAGASVADPARARAAVADGDCGTALHDRGVRKVYAARDAPETIDLKP
jgi:uncharacterized protein (DUF4213/DUF364 family)